MRLFVLNTLGFRPSDAVKDWVYHPLLAYQEARDQMVALRERIHFLQMGLAAQRAGCTNKSIWSCIFQFLGHKRHEFERLAVFRSLQRGIFLRKVPWIQPGPMKMNKDTEEWERC